MKGEEIFVVSENELSLISLLTNIIICADLAISSKLYPLAISGFLYTSVTYPLPGISYLWPITHLFRHGKPLDAHLMLGK